MLRKKIAIFFFALIQIILFGHGVILHHHSVDEHSSHHQHGSQSKEEKSPNNSPFDIAFSSLQHAGEQVVFNLNITQDFSLIKKGSSLFYTLIACFDFSNVYIFNSPQHIFPPDKFLFFNQLLDSTYFLRGPPVYFFS